MFQDLRHSARMLIKNPGFTLISVLSMAIGVGANAAMFSVADGLVIRPLPVPRAGEIMTISAVRKAGGRSSGLSHPEYLVLRDQTHSFNGVVAYQLVVTTFINRPDEPAQRRAGMAVSGNYFDAMQLRPALGRFFRPDEDRVPGRDAVLVLDHDEWQQRFAADPAIVDRRIRVGGMDFTVIGVAPAGFTSIDHDLHPSFYVPLAMYTAVQNGAPADALTRRDVRAFTVKGRLNPGVSIEQAREDVRQIAANLERAYPDTNRNRSFIVRTQLDAFTSGPGRADATFVAMLVTLAFVVLVVACANIAGLLTSRAPARSRDIAMRLAIGAGRSRIVRQLVTETLLVAIGGAALGLLFGYAVIAMFQRIEYPTDIPLKLTYALDARALIVGIVVATAAAIASSLVPAWRASRTDLVSTIKDPGAVASRRQRLWGRSTLVCSQIALSLTLLTVSMFLYRSFQAEFTKGPGFRTDHMLTVTFEPGLARYDDARTGVFYRQVKESVQALPGVTSVSLASAAPMKTGDIRNVQVAPEGFQFRQGADNVAVPSINIDERYFATTGIPIVNGRAFSPNDTSESPRVAIVNQTFAARYWPGQNPVGKRLRLDSADRAFAEVVGVAADVKYFFIVESPVEFVYLSQMQGSLPRTTLLVGTRDAAAGMAAPVRDVVRAIDPNMPVFGVRTLEDFYDSRIVYTSQLVVGSVVGMGSMGLVLALVGLYGLVSYNAQRRTREIGIRIAVGANPAAVLRMVLRHGLTLAISGIVMGLIVSTGANQAMGAAFAATVFGRIGSDGALAVYAQTVAALIGVVMLAAYLPARRAARIDPLQALKTD
jgi:putative ABC transport system permease protein